MCQTGVLARIFVETFEQWDGGKKSSIQKKIVDIGVLILMPIFATVSTTKDH